MIVMIEYSSQDRPIRILGEHEEWFPSFEEDKPLGTTVHVEGVAKVYEAR